MSYFCSLSSKTHQLGPWGLPGTGKITILSRVGSATTAGGAVVKRGVSQGINAFTLIAVRVLMTAVYDFAAGSCTRAEYDR